MGKSVRLQKEVKAMARGKGTRVLNSFQLFMGDIKSGAVTVPGVSKELPYMDQMKEAAMVWEAMTDEAQRPYSERALLLKSKSEQEEVEYQAKVEASMAAEEEAQTASEARQAQDERRLKKKRRRDTATKKSKKNPKKAKKADPDTRQAVRNTANKAMWASIAQHEKSQLETFRRHREVIGPFVPVNTLSAVCCLLSPTPSPSPNSFLRPLCWTSCPPLVLLL
jgi:hypothetical protein